MEIHIGTLSVQVLAAPAHCGAWTTRIKSWSVTAWFVIQTSEGGPKEIFYIARRGSETRRNSASIWLSIGDFRFVPISLFRVSLPRSSLISRARARAHARTPLHTCFLSVETLLSWDLPEVEARSSTPQSKCLCQTSGCLCCVELNLTSTIDLGGPACVNIKQKEQNVSLNLSYGDNPVHNATIRIGK